MREAEREALRRAMLRQLVVQGRLILRHFLRLPSTDEAAKMVDQFEEMIDEFERISTTDSVHRDFKLVKR